MNLHRSLLTIFALLINHYFCFAEEKFYPEGNGRIPIAKVEDFPRIASFDVSDENRFWYTYRPNLLGAYVEPEWDFYNLINTDRPDFTDATFSAGKGVTIIESGYTFREISNQSLAIHKQQLPEVLTRVGLTDEFEIRMKWNGLVMTQTTDPVTGLSANQFGGDDLNLGFKYEIAQQNGLVPMFTFVGSTMVPSGTHGFSANQLQPTANLVYGWGLRRWLYLKMSTGVDFLRNSNPQLNVGTLQGSPITTRTFDNTSDWHQSASMLYQVSKRIGGFAEWYSFFRDNGQDNRAQHFIDTGTFIYLTQHLQLDARVGKQLSTTDENFFTGAGFSVRF